MAEGNGDGQSSDRRGPPDGQFQKGVVPTTAFTPESARAAGLKSAEARKARVARRAADPAFALREDLQEALPDLTADLLKAARGRAPFDTLPPDKRLAALFRALEYAVGRPTTVDKAPPPDAPTKDPDGGEAEQPGGIRFE